MVDRDLDNIEMSDEDTLLTDKLTLDLVTDNPFSGVELGSQPEPENIEHKI